MKQIMDDLRSLGVAKTFVPPEGDLQTAKIMLVGEQPGKSEVQNRRPFIGPSGRELNECLLAVGVPRTTCYITNYAKDFDNHVSRYARMTVDGPSYSREGLLYQRLLLEHEVRKTSAKVIVPMGNAALMALTERTGITKWRGSVIESHLVPGKFIVPTIHPATIIPPKNVYLNKFLIQFDLMKAKRIAESGFRRKNRRLVILPSFNQTMEYLAKLEKVGHGSRIVYFDIEINKSEEVSCISFAYRDDEAISIPFLKADGDYYSIEQETEIWKKIATILENPRIRKCGQNISFDTHFLLRRYGIKAVNLEDTMIAQRIIMPEYPIGLDFITSVWTDHEYYKDEGKKYFAAGYSDQLWRYNATDSLMCAEAFPKQLKKIKQQGNDETYERQRSLVPPLVYMQERGIRVDLVGMAKRATTLEEEIGELQEELDTLAGCSLNPKSPKQLQAYFYGKKGHPAYKNRKTGSPTTDAMAMKRLARKGVKEAKIILDIRKRRDIISRYLNPNKVDEDGRIRCSFNPVGTKFSRLSSSANIFGTGTNMQNWPHDILQYLLFDEGYIGYTIDLSQAENRIVAYVGNVGPMIDAFEGGKDVHSLTAALIFQKHIDQVTREDGTCPLGDGTHSERFWGKKANHGLNYDLGYKTFALYYEIPERDARFIVERYHMAYPGVRNNFHALVRRMLRNGRTITNLLGRKTVFMDKWGDSLFKEAYSCIPQGSVGDIINERGVNYIYYDEFTFGPVELLLQVHDDIKFQIPRSLGWREHARILLDIKRSLETPLKTYDGREFVIPADITVCPINFAKEGTSKDLKEFPGNIPEAADLLKRTVEEIENGARSNRLD